MIYFLSYVPIAYDIRPRFFLPMIGLPFIFAGYISLYFFKKDRLEWKILALLIPTAIIIANLFGTYQWFNEIKEAQKKGINPKRTIILKAKDGIILWHLEQTTDYMKNNCPNKTIYFYTSSEYRRPIKYLLDLKGDNPLTVDNMQIGEPACAYVVLRTRGQGPASRLNQAFQNEFEIGSQHKFGALSVWDLKLRSEFIGKTLETYHKGQDEMLDTKRIFWKDIFKKKIKEQ